MGPHKTVPKKRILLLVLTCLVLGALVVLDNWNTRTPQPPAPAERAGAPAGAPADSEALAGEADRKATELAGLQLDNPLASVEVAELQNWVERPLFASSRKRPPAPGAGAQRTAARAISQQAAPSYDLLGILREGERAIALLRRKGEGTSFRVEVGDMIGGWRVARMEATSVLLERADGTAQTVELPQD
jgi:hypothetical protein